MSQRRSSSDLPTSPGRTKASRAPTAHSALREALLPSHGGGPLLELRAPGDDAAGGFALDLQRVYASINSSVSRHVKSLQPVRASKDLLAVLELVVNESVTRELAACKMRLSSKSRLDHFLHYVVNLLCVPFVSSVFGQGALSNLAVGAGSDDGVRGRGVLSSISSGLSSAVSMLSLLQWDAEGSGGRGGDRGVDDDWHGRQGDEEDDGDIDADVAALRVLLCDMLALFVIAELLHDRGLDASALDAAYVELAISLLLYRSTPLVPLYLTLSSCGLDIVTPITCQVLSVRALAEDVRSSIDTLLMQCSDALLAGDTRHSSNSKSSASPRAALRAPLLQYLSWLRASREPLVRMCRVAEVTAFLDDRLCMDLKNEDYGSPQDVVTEYRYKYKERLSIIPLPVQPVTAFDATQAQRDVVRELLAVNGELVDAAFVEGLVVRRFDSSTGHYAPIVGGAGSEGGGDDGRVDVKVLAETTSWCPDMSSDASPNDSNTSSSSSGGATGITSDAIASDSAQLALPSTPPAVECLRLYVQSLLEAAVQDKIKGEAAQRTGDMKAARAAASAAMSDMLEIASDSTDSENEAAWRNQRNSSDSSSSGGSSLFPAISINRPGSGVGSALSANLALVLSNRSMYNVIVDRIMQQVLIACSRTIAGGDAYSVLEEFYGGPGLILCPRRTGATHSSPRQVSTKARSHAQLPDVAASVSIRINDRGICVILKSVFDLFEIEDGSVTSQAPLVSFKARTTTVIRYPNTDLSSTLGEPWRLNAVSIDDSGAPRASHPSSGPASTAPLPAAPVSTAAADRALRASLRRAMLQGMGDILSDAPASSADNPKAMAASGSGNNTKAGLPGARGSASGTGPSQPRVPTDLERSRLRTAPQDPAKSASINAVLQRFLMEDTQVFRGLYIEPYLDKAFNNAS